MRKTISLKHVLLITLQCLVSAALPAQPPKQWDKRFGGTSYDALNSLQQTDDGGYILGGESNSGISGDKTEDSRGGSDYWVVKIDANGVKQWDKRFGGTDYEALYSLQQTKDGGYILGGGSNSGIGGDKTEDSRGFSDYWVVKIDANGVKQWDKRFGGTEYDNLISLQQTADGGYILGGGSGSGIGGDKTEDSRGIIDYWVVKIDANGVKQWDKRFGGTDEDFLLSLQQTADGGYILGGYSNSGIGGDKTEEVLGLQDYWVVKIDANGIKQWDKRFGGTSNEGLRSLQQTADGGYILGGTSNSGIGGDKTEDSWGGNGGFADYWVVKIDANGVKQWDKRFGGTGFDILYSLQQTADGGYILGGYSNSGLDGDKTEESWGNIDYWVVKIDANGVKQWDKRFGGTDDDYLLSLQETEAGGYILGGYSSSGIGGDKTEDTRGDSDYWIVKLGSLACNDVYETNNTSSEAKAISLGTTISPIISSAIDEDWFKVTLPNGNNRLEVTLSNLPADYDLYVYAYKRNLRLVGSSANMGTSNELVSFSSHARNATYYIKVIGKNGAYNVSECYNLLAQFGSSAQPVTNVSNLIDEITEESAKQMLYPIPASDFVHLRFNSNVAGPSTVQILNTVGQLVKQYAVNIAKGINELQIPLHDVKPGMYILKINKEGLNIMRKLAIAK
jgi:hypothetical protein